MVIDTNSDKDIADYVSDADYKGDSSDDSDDSDDSDKDGRASGGITVSSRSTNDFRGARGNSSYAGEGRTSRGSVSTAGNSPNTTRDSGARPSRLSSLGLEPSALLGYKSLYSDTRSEILSPITPSRRNIGTIGTRESYRLANPNLSLEGGGGAAAPSKSATTKGTYKVKPSVLTLSYITKFYLPI